MGPNHQIAGDRVGSHVQSPRTNPWAVASVVALGATFTVGVLLDPVVFYALPGTPYGLPTALFFALTVALAWKARQEISKSGDGGSGLARASWHVGRVGLLVSVVFVASTAVVIGVTKEPAKYHQLEVQIGHAAFPGEVAPGFKDITVTDLRYPVGHNLRTQYGTESIATFTARFCAGSRGARFNPNTEQLWVDAFETVAGQGRTGWGSPADYLMAVPKTSSRPFQVAASSCTTRPFAALFFVFRHPALTGVSLGDVTWRIGRPGS